MPLIITAPTGGPPTPVPGPAPPSLLYVDPDGRTWDLGDRDSGVVALSVAGISSPAALLSSLGLPAGGALVQGYQPAIRTIIIGVFLEAADQATFLALCDQWARATWTQRAGQPAPGTLVVARPDGTSRQIQVYLTDGGQQIDDDHTRSGLTWTTFIMTFTALDPIWSDGSTMTVTFSAPPAGGGVPAMPPVLLDPATTLGDTVVTNDGDSDAYPIWTITGPGKPTITNVTTGLAFGLDATLGSGEVVTVDTRPLMQSAIDGIGANRWPDLVRSNPRSLWQIVPGDNELNVQMTGSGVGTQVGMSFTRRWLRA